MVKRDPRDQQAWIAAGVRALVSGGVSAVRVEPLAAALGVTKGSFYWHFADRAALLQAMLGWWEKVATREVIDQVERAGGDAARKLRTLVSICTSGAGDRLESAMRAWAAHDPAAEAALSRVDEQRERYVMALFREHGLSAAQARHRTRLLYLSLIGAFAWSAHGGEPSPKETWRAAVELLLAN